MTQLSTIARVNHGRWLADCPVCRGAELVQPGKLFRCQSKPCTAVAQVIWPDERTRVRIEQLLTARPDHANRNWTPGETVLQLARENKAHGLTTKGA